MYIQFSTQFTTVEHFFGISTFFSSKSTQKRSTLIVFLFFFGAIVSLHDVYFRWQDQT